MLPDSISAEAIAALPVADTLPALLATLAAGRNAVLVAPPGAGKTSLVPLALLGAPWRGDQRIILLEPRRIATRAAAARMAQLLAEPVGRTVGYRTRLDRAVSDATRIEVLTEGLLLRRLQSDPGLAGVAAIILDEVHERSLDADLALALCRDLQTGLRPELRIIAMSATAEAARLAALLDAEIIASDGQQFPVEISHAARDIASLRDLPDTMGRAIRAALAAHDGDILAFLPGMADIRRTEAALAGCAAELLALHGDLPPAAQDLVLRPNGAGRHRRVVLATAIAETSLTVPGVRVVIDGGWRRSPVLDAASQLPRLTTLRISRAAAAQRAGRAGREAPGVAIRLWSAALHRGLAAHEAPEIMGAELSGLLLDCLSWGAAPDALPFPDPPPPGALAAAGALLDSLGARDAQGRLTDLGRKMARLGAHPRLAAMMLGAETPAEAALAADLAALLEERDPLRQAPLHQAPLHQAGARRTDPPAEIGLRLALLEPGGGHGIDAALLSRLRRGAAQYRARLDLPAQIRASGDPGRLIAAGFPDRIAQARGAMGSFRLSGGGGARLADSDSLARKPLLAVAGIELGRAARIRLAAALDPAQLPPAVAAQIITQTESGFDPATGAVLSRRRRRLGALVLEDRMVAADPVETAATLATAIAARGLAQGLDWDDAARQFQARVAWLRGIAPDAWPDLSDAALTAQVQIWLAPHLLGIARLAEAARLEMLPLLRSQLEWAQLQKLDAGLPSHITLPGGRAAVDYTQAVPVAAARAQAFYGLDTTPLLAGGQVPLRLALLSPAGRPVAVIGDLPGFWRGAWGDARRDMRGRYPRHDWPEQPWLAPARARGN